MKVKEVKAGNGEYSFKCPGCGDEHRVPTKTRQHNGAI